MATYREALARVVTQLEQATLADGTPTFAEVAIGRTSRDEFPCAIVAADDASHLCIKAFALAGDAARAEQTILDCAESACHALGIRMHGAFNWSMQRGVLYRTWTYYYSVF